MFFNLKRKEITKTLFALILVLVVVTGICFSVMGASEEWIGKTKTLIDYVNVRYGPTTSSYIVTSIPPQTQFKIHGQTNSDDGYVWYKISYNGYEGYMRSDLVVIVSGGPSCSETSGDETRAPDETTDWENASAGVGFSAPTFASVGSNINVVVDVTGNGIGGYEAKISYDANYLHFVSASGLSENFSYADKSGVVTLVDYVSSGSASSLSCILTFEPKKNGSTDITLSEGVFVNGAGDEIEPSYEERPTVNIVSLPKVILEMEFDPDIIQEFGTVVVGKTSMDGMTMTAEELTDAIGDENVTVTSSNGVVGTGSIISIDGYELIVVFKGDVDGDGRLNVFDALMTKKAIADNAEPDNRFGEADIREYAADIDGSGSVDENDLKAMLEHIVDNNSIA